MTARSEHNVSESRSRRSSPDADEIQAGEGALQDEVDGGRSGFIGRTQQAATGFAHTALQKSGEAISGAAEAVGQTASSLMERTNEMARRTRRAASITAGRTSSSIGQLAREQPLLVAGVGFALGVALGALLPLTRAENELLGEQAERLKENAKELATEGYEKVKSVAQRTYDAATETLKGETESSSESGISTTQTGSDNGGETGTTVYRH